MCIAGCSSPKPEQRLLGWAVSKIKQTAPFTYRINALKCSKCTNITTVAQSSGPDYKSALSEPQSVPLRLHN